MIGDPGFEAAVDAFVEELTPIVRALASRVPSVDARALEGDVVREAFAVAAAFIDCDGIHTDAELWSLLVAFGPRLEGDLVRAAPDDVRRAGLVAGRAAWLDTPSTMLDLLARYDAREGTSHARTYHDRAMAIAFAVAAIDPYTTEAELRAIERFRATLARAGSGPGAAVPPGVPAAATQDAAGAVDGAPPAPDELPPARPLEELMAELDGLVGLAGVKAEVKLVTDLIRVQNLRRERDLPVLDQSRHLVFAGNPGTGKTTVARLLAQIYRTLGVVERGHLVETDRSGMVAGFVGQTAPLVRKVFDEADGGVLLVDEAYALARGGERDFGQEAIDTLVKLIEDRRDRVVVIAAGYTDEMAGFIGANPGLRSRFPKTIVFPDYSTDELLRIFDGLGEKGGYRCDESADAKVRAWFDAQPRDKGFGNGRTARNLFEAAVARQASRVVQIEDVTDEQLTTLTAEDIPDVDEPLGGVPGP
ncbi:MAG: AAA family ATPase [Actinobacteria bacterium]|nr:AAA family ATPase [Actinomycetota bacterium]